MKQGFYLSAFLLLSAASPVFASIQLSSDGPDIEFRSERSCQRALIRQHRAEEARRPTADTNAKTTFDGKELRHEMWSGYTLTGYTKRCEGKSMKTFNLHIVSEPPPR